ncbi:hypothetical protein [Caulobacter endophyticus]|uniref:Uncharacterized protein n=1 Tax=Caulobacter endophyticus TaxID=2172652 RepID=A0A2T9K3X8_9CAUL|nr:hypothetical protein [Caulobacter endophyticus]PVM90685.1 hypothetical protein DDF67_09655 [Caulobacter endophyticus]
MDPLLTVLAIAVVGIWAAASAYLLDVATEAADQECRPLDAFDWLQIALGPITYITILMESRRDR